MLGRQYREAGQISQQIKSLTQQLEDEQQQMSTLQSQLSTHTTQLSSLNQQVSKMDDQLVTFKKENGTFKDIFQYQSYRNKHRTCLVLRLSKFVMVNTNLILSCCKCNNEACSMADNKSHTEIRLLILVVQGKMSYEPPVEPQV